MYLNFLQLQFCTMNQWRLANTNEEVQQTEVSENIWAEGKTFKSFLVKIAFLINANFKHRFIGKILTKKAWQ